MDATYQYLVRMLAHEMKHYADRKLDEYNVTQEQSHTLGYMYAGTKIEALHKMNY